MEYVTELGEGSGHTRSRVHIHGANEKVRIHSFAISLMSVDLHFMPQ